MVRPWPSRPGHGGAERLRSYSSGREPHAVGDLKNAFCQSRKLERARGRLFVEPCDGVPVPKGCLVELIAPVYGLDDAPLQWHLTLTSWLKEEGFQKCLFEPCLWFRRFGPSDLDMILIEVDDLVMSIAPSRSEEFKARANGRFKFGKWRVGESDFAGRRLRQREDRLLIDQEKYILENVFPMTLAKGRASTPDSPLKPHEAASLRSLIYQISWVAKETRPEAAGMASLMASKLPEATVGDVGV
eukprot:6160969-Lingulodinium_polyedra.AAC.1